jgi:hypothetical protein
MSGQLVEQRLRILQVAVSNPSVKGCARTKTGHFAWTGCPARHEPCVCVSPEKGRAPPMKQKIAGADSERIGRELAGLIGLSRDKLKQRWRALYDTEPPDKSSQDFLKAAIAYRLQERALGGLKPGTRRLLERSPRTSARANRSGANRCARRRRGRC